MAILNQRVAPNTPIARALGFDPYGVIVDNVTAYWLYFPQADQYCPPFVMGWSVPFTLNMAGYGYMEIKTPFGQTVQTNVTANISQYVNLIWTDQLVSSSQGTSIDPGDVTTSSVSPLVTVQFSASVVVSVPTIVPIVTAITTKRIRIHALSVTKVFTGNVAVNTLDGYVFGFIQRSSTGASITPMSFSSERINIIENFVPGIDLDVGEGVTSNWQAIMCDAEIIGTLTYEYI